MGRSKQRVERIKKEIPIIAVLASFGYQVRSDGGDREQQFPCDLHGDGQDNKPSARVYPDSQQFYCVAENQPILSSVGWTKLEALKRHPHLVLAGTGQFQKPVAYLEKGTKETVRLVTKEGYSVVLTPDHQVFRHRGLEIPVVALRKGDRIDLALPRQPAFSKDPQLPIRVDDINSFRSPGRHNKLTLPSTWSVELGEILGYLFGDGWVACRERPHSSHVGLTAHVDDAEDARHAFAFLRQHAGGGGSERPRTDKTCCNGKTYQQNQVVWTLGSNGVVEFLSRLGLDKRGSPSQRRIPGALWGAPKEGVRGFLRGLFATDGSVFSSPNRKYTRISLYSVSDGFLTDVQLLLHQFGIRSRVYVPAKGRNLFYLQISAGEGVALFRERIGIANSRKQTVLDAHVYNPKFKQPTHATFEKLEPLGLKVVADVSMPGDPSFCAGGLRVHNCFACDRSRDAIELVRIKKNLSFPEAMSWLEAQYGLQPLPWEGPESEAPSVSLTDECEARITPPVTFGAGRDRVKTILDRASLERSLSLDRLLAYWETYDYLTYQVTQAGLDERLAKQKIGELYHRLTKEMLG